MGYFLKPGTWPDQNPRPVADRRAILYWHCEQLDFVPLDFGSGGEWVDSRLTAAADKTGRTQDWRLAVPEKAVAR